jgi:uncharacterized sulfatase
VRNERYQYVRNYYPQLPAGQHNAYMFETPSTQAWKKLYDAGQLNPTQSQFWQRKAPEELYDLQADPDEVVNVVSSSQLQSVLQDLRAALDNWERAIRDVAFLPEDELHSRAPALSPYDLGHDDQKYPFERIYGMASRASNLKEEETPALIAGLGDPDSAVRYWAAEGLQARGPAAVAAGHDALRRAVETDPSWSVRVAAAQALGKSGTDADLSPALNCLVQAADGSTHGHYIASAALSALDALGPKARPIASQLAALPTEGPWTPARGADSVKRLLDHVLANLK